MPKNQVIERLLSTGGGQAFALGGFLSTATEGAVRLYQALSTEAYIEVDRKSILHIEEQDIHNGEAVVYVNGDASIRLAFEREVNVRDIRPEPDRPASSPPDQPSEGGVSATTANGLTVCAGGLNVILCAFPVIGPYGHIHWAYKLHSVYVVCSPGNTWLLFC